MASEALPCPKISVSTLPHDHYAAFEKALWNVLFTELAELTMAQLVDGLPIWPVYLDSKGLFNLRGHPIRDHKELCEGALERTKAFRSSFKPSELLLKSSSIRAFESCPPDTREFDLRLLELIAEAVHAMAVILFNLEEKSHTGDIQSVLDYRAPPKTIEIESGFTVTCQSKLPLYPTMFTFPCYNWPEQYPNGLADVAAYWAEDKIFGGVFLFDRDVFLHSNRRKWTWRVWSLLDAQFKQLMGFLKGDPSVITSPFPLCADEHNAHRFDDYDAMKYHNIYRDPWERKLPDEKNWDEIRLNPFDYPRGKELGRNKTQPV
ncbi:hypothetical protein E4U42_000187 [Claviceps africana]|uniref:Uncharacterized protein n=1 Tax=Claviceps africana TaxID=83212 RepID=A0A8K0J5Q5_9HYPO|nr:hypothetical protein E4U42_000187 [Claviceps africana]